LESEEKVNQEERAKGGRKKKKERKKKRKQVKERKHVKKRKMKNYFKYFTLIQRLCVTFLCQQDAFTFQLKTVCKNWTGQIFSAFFTICLHYFY
jgi:hypothetical protein